MFESYPFTEADGKSDRFKRILAWLLVQGAPEGKLITVASHLPGHGTVTEYQVTFSRDGFSLQDVNAGLLLRAPSLVLTDLQVHFRFGNPTEGSFFDYVREIPQPLPGPTPLPERPANPIGAPITGDPDSYHGVPGDDYPAGYIYTSPEGVKYIKRRRFIFSAVSEWWDRLA